MKEGFTKAYRKELHSDIWRMPPLYHRVFFYLRQKACWKNDSFPTRKGFGIALCPGQLITSLSLISQEVAWQEYGIKRSPNKKTVRDILSWLSDNSMIEIESNRHGTFIIIVNWDTYQPPPTEEVTQKKRKRNAKETQKKRSTDTLKEDKEDKELNKENKKEKATPLIPPEKIILPEWLPEKLWQSFVAHRKSFKPAMTVHAEKLNLNKLIKFKQEGCNPEEIINETISNGWKGFYKPKEAFPPKKKIIPDFLTCQNCGVQVIESEIHEGKCPSCKTVTTFI